MCWVRCSCAYDSAYSSVNSGTPCWAKDIDADSWEYKYPQHSNTYTPDTHVSSSKVRCTWCTQEKKVYWDISAWESYMELVHH